MRTILTALKDELIYPVSEGFILNRLLKRGLNPEMECSADILTGDAFNGAVADCLYGIIDAPNISEAGLSISKADKDLILLRVNKLYNLIGEPTVGQPTIEIICY